MNSRILFAALALAGFSCAPLPCESISSNPQSVCRRADAGAIAANTPFVVEGQTFVRNGTCSVSVDGGQITLAVDGMACSAANGRSDFEAAPAAPSFVKCNVPALAAGTYTVSTSTPSTFTVPEGADGGLAACP